jgi:hypothetical protein
VAKLVGLSNGTVARITVEMRGTVERAVSDVRMAGGMISKDLDERLDPDHQDFQRQRMSDAELLLVLAAGAILICIRGISTARRRRQTKADKEAS